LSKYFEATGGDLLRQVFEGIFFDIGFEWRFEGFILIVGPIEGVEKLMLF
jgi:hypothetical protein